MISVERETSIRFRTVTRAVLFGASLFLASCSNSNQAPNSLPVTQASPKPTSPDGCVDTPSLHSSVEALKAEAKKRDGGQYDDVAGINTSYEGHKWKVGSNWRSGGIDDFGWEQDPEMIEGSVRYNLERDQVTVNNHPYETKQGGVYFDYSEYEPVCDPGTIDVLRHVIEPLPAAKNCFLEDC